MELAIALVIGAGAPILVSVLAWSTRGRFARAARSRAAPSTLSGGAIKAQPVTPVPPAPDSPSSVGWIRNTVGQPSAGSARRSASSRWRRRRRQ